MHGCIVVAMELNDHLETSFRYGGVAIESAGNWLSQFVSTTKANYRRIST